MASRTSDLRSFLRILAPGICCALGLWGTQADDSISFNRDIRPILSDKCFQCHGPDERQQKAGLRLDVRATAIASRDGGLQAIVPGRSESSLLIQRIESADPDEQMPPMEVKNPLDDAERELLRRWIDEGAEYESHWAWLPPERHPLPISKVSSWARNPIDFFVLDRLEREGISPVPEADPNQLFRRVSYVLNGLPPAEDEVNAIRSQHPGDAYEVYVDRLLGSSRFGEHMASVWLDAARYSDTNGYNNDTPRYNWRYRDWVIDAFNRNLSYDRFLIEQLAGDLLPDPSLDQLIATGFNRNHNVTSEGGIIDEEYRLEYVADRVQTTATVFMALTLRCARCHDHKFDPFTQREYYQFFSFFNQVPEAGYHKEHVGNPHPVVKAPVEADARRLEVLQEAITLAASEPLRESLEEKKSALEKSLPTAMVMQDLVEPRQTFVLMRGDYREAGEEVTGNTPKVFPAMEKNAPRNRLGLAEWLTRSDHPLTARVAVNRLWYQVFGRGLVTSLEDFGSQGAWPSHPELLDWLATELIRLNWDQKAILRMMVRSATFRQHSGTDASRRQIDPDNRLLSRGPRYRLPAEVIRDSALWMGGLLESQLGGPSVRPYQPPGLWTEVIVADDSYSGGKYVPDTGPGLYRRSVYTWWKRTCPPPSLNTFDAPDREFCAVQRARTNTPLQALVLLNDPTYVEAARGLARGVLSETVGDYEGLETMFKRATNRFPEDRERALLTRILRQERNRFNRAPDEATAFLEVGVPLNSAGIASEEWAAWSVVASLLLNLDEVITLH